MTKPKPGEEAAFPIAFEDRTIPGQITTVYSEGMTFRQYAAVAAMQGLLACPHETDIDIGKMKEIGLPEIAISIADALIKELEK